MIDKNQPHIEIKKTYSHMMITNNFIPGSQRRATVIETNERDGYSVNIQARLSIEELIKLKEWLNDVIEHINII